MASISRVANSNATTTAGGNAGTFNEIHSGGNINFYQIAGTAIQGSYTNADSAWEKAVKAMSGFGTVVILGTPASNVAIVGLEGSATDATTLAAMGTATTAASGISCTVTSVSLSAAAFA